MAEVPPNDDFSDVVPSRFSRSNYVPKSRQYNSKKPVPASKMYGPELPNIFDALEKGDVELVKNILDFDPNYIEKRQVDAKSPIQVAVEKDSGEMVRTLLIRGADVTAETSRRQTIVHYALDIGSEEIYELLHKVEKTQWMPGEDPDLMYVPKEVSSKAAGIDMRQLAKDKPSDILTRVGQEKWIPQLEQHGIDFRDFLRMDDASLADIGIWCKEDRAKIVQAVAAAKKTAWKKTELFPGYMNPTVASSEFIAILNNLNAHCDGLKNLMNTLNQQMAKDPKALRNYLEKAPIEDTTVAAASAIEEIRKFKGDLKNLTSAIRQLALRQKKYLKDQEEPVGLSPRLYWFICGTAVLGNCIGWMTYAYWKLKKSD